MTLDRDAASRALDRVAKPLGLSTGRGGLGDLLYRLREHGGGRHGSIWSRRARPAPLRDDWDLAVPLPAHAARVAHILGVHQN